MSVVSFALILFSVLLGAVGQLLLKAGTNAVGTYAFHPDSVVRVGLQLAGNPYILGGILCYVISLVGYLMALSRVEVSIAYPMVSIGYVVNALGAWYLFGEAVTPMRVAGTGIIILGVYIVARS